MILYQPFFFTKSCRRLIVAIIMQVFCIAAFAQSDDNIDDSVRINNDKIYHGIASFYGDKFNGRKTASGDVFDQKKYTAACNKLPLGTWIRVTNIHNGHSVIVRVNDRLHPKMKRIVDLSKAAAKKINIVNRGIAKVKVEVLENYRKKDKSY